MYKRKTKAMHNKYTLSNDILVENKRIDIANENIYQ